MSEETVQLIGEDYSLEEVNLTLIGLGGLD